MAQWLKKNLPANAGDVGDQGLMPGLGRSPGRGDGNPLQYPCLENYVDLVAMVHGVAQSRTRLKRWSMNFCVKDREVLCLRAALWR